MSSGKHSNSSRSGTEGPKVYVSELNFDYHIDIDTLRAALAASLGDPSQLSISTESHGGEFPFLVRIVLPDADKAPTLEQLQGISRRLNAIMLTDDVAVGPLFDDGYTLISPDGTTAVVHTDEEGPDGADIVLSAEFRALYRTVETRLSPVVANQVQPSPHPKTGCDGALREAGIRPEFDLSPAGNPWRMFQSSPHPKTGCDTSRS